MSHARKYCAIKSCNNNNLNTIMHNFSMKDGVYEEWLRAVGRRELFLKEKKKVCKNMYVCDIHFSESAKTARVSKSNLLPGSVPTLFLDTFLNSEDVNSPELQINQGPDPEMVHDSIQAETTNLEPQPSTSTFFVDKIPSGRKQCLESKLLKTVSVTRKKMLSPQGQMLHSYAQNLQRVGRRLLIENISNKKRLQEAMKAAETGERLRAKMSETAFKFFLSQIKLQQYEPRGRRFSNEDKAFALALYKQSPKLYRFLSKVFALPSRQCLQKFLNRVPIGPGINKPIIDLLQENVSKMDEDKKYCALLFDEMSLSTGLYFNKMSSSIDGFIHCGESKKMRFADHVMVFMIRGILIKWKQPIAYFFVEYGMGVPDLTRNVKTIIKQLQDIGLYVVCTICDQYTTNTKVIKTLIEETNRKYILEGEENRTVGFQIGDQEIIPLFDPPHLLKCVRNNLLRYNAEFKWKDTNFIACWSDVVKLHEMDNGDSDSKLLSKITDCHVYEQSMNKMKVNLAAQVFSQRTSATMKFVVKNGNEFSKTETMWGTAEFLLFFDKLFDSVNGSSILLNDNKPLKCAITEESGHAEFYFEAIDILRTIRFKKSSGSFVPPCITNWITTIKNIHNIWNKLNSAGVKNLCPRNMNQDPLENFFGSIRSYGARNINPTCASFMSSYKALLVNNIMTINSPYLNCETDECEGALNSLKIFLTKEFTLPRRIAPSNITDIFSFNITYNFLRDNTNAYIAGYLARHILKVVRGCNICKTELISDSSEIIHSYIECRNYNRHSLMRPSTNFFGYISNSFQIINFYLIKICIFEDLVPYLKSKINELNSLRPFTCTEHNLINVIDNYMISFYILMWVKNVNNILHGKEHIKINDIVKKIASTKYKRMKSRKAGISRRKQLKN